MKKAIITGVRRIGYEIAKSLLEKGWRVGLVYKSSEHVYRELREAFGDRVYGVRADLSLWQEAESSTNYLA